MGSEDYRAWRRLEDADGPCYIREERIDLIKRVNALIFDCDGVLVDTRPSFDRAIVKTASYFVSRVTGAPFPERFISTEVLYRFRMSGGFNNDWDTTYIILLHTFSQLPKTVIDGFTKAWEATPADGFDIPSRLTSNAPSKEEELLNVYRGLEAGLIRLSKRADASGYAPLERLIMDGNTSIRDALLAFKRMLGYPGVVGESVLATVFNELYYGPDLFKKAYGAEARLKPERGLIGDERPLVTRETLAKLAQLFGRERLGIASGRGRLATELVLGDLLGYMNREAMVFIEDEEQLLEPNRRVKVGKPKPYSLLKAAQAIPDAKIVVYVGDSFEDLLMVKEANRVEERFLFAGVYLNSYSAEDQGRVFMEQGADVVAPTVNSLPFILAACGRG